MRDYDTLIANTDPIYQKWLSALVDDIVVENDVVHLFSRPSIPERNETNEMETYLPEHLLIGDDSGDMVFVLSLKAVSPIWWVDAGSLQIDTFRVVSPSFATWQASSFALPAEQAYHLPLRGDIFVDNVPDIRTMFAIKTFLSLGWGATEMKELLRKQPFLAIKNGCPIGIEQKLKKSPTFKDYVFFANGSKLERICS